MGRKRFKPLPYDLITNRAETTITILMAGARVETNSRESRMQSEAWATGAYLLWTNLTNDFANTQDDDRRLADLLKQWQ